MLARYLIKKENFNEYWETFPRSISSIHRGGRFSMRASLPSNWNVYIERLMEWNGALLDAPYQHELRLLIVK